MTIYVRTFLLGRVAYSWLVLQHAGTITGKGHILLTAPNQNVSPLSKVTFVIPRNVSQFVITRESSLH